MLDQQQQLDLAFHALADPTRRAMVERMTRGPAAASDLAAPFAMSLAAVLQHLKVLEQSSLVRTRKQGRTRICELDLVALRAVEDWIAARRSLWERRLDLLGDVLAEFDREERNRP